MKSKLIYLIVMLQLCSCQVEAKGINAYVDGAVWEAEGRADWNPNVYLIIKYYIEGKEKINDIEYLKMYQSITHKNLQNNEIMWSDDHYAGSVRNKDGKIYLVPPKFNEEFLIFDFNLIPTDKVEIYPYVDSSNPRQSVSLICAYTSEFIIGDSRVKLLNLSNDGKTQYYRLNEWIEGIGTSVGPLTPVYAETGGIFTTVTRVTINGKVVYQYSAK